MKNKRIVIVGPLILVSALIFVFRIEIEDWLQCHAYYDQCTAQRIEGLTREECFERDGNVAYLLDDGICLIKSK